MPPEVCKKCQVPGLCLCPGSDLCVRCKIVEDKSAFYSTREENPPLVLRVSMHPKPRTVESQKVLKVLCDSLAHIKEKPVFLAKDCYFMPIKE